MSWRELPERLGFIEEFREWAEGVLREYAAKEGVHPPRLEVIYPREAPAANLALGLFIAGAAYSPQTRTVYIHRGYIKHWGKPNFEKVMRYLLAHEFAHHIEFLPLRYLGPLVEKLRLVSEARAVRKAEELSGVKRVDAYRILREKGYYWW